MAKTKKHRGTGGVFQKMQWNVTPKGDNVVLTMGNADIEFGYETALQMSQALRIAGKEAKMFAGDFSRHWSVIGVLRDAQENFKRLIKPNLRYEDPEKIKHITGGTG